MDETMEQHMEDTSTWTRKDWAVYVIENLMDSSNFGLIFDAIKLYIAVQDIGYNYQAYLILLSIHFSLLINEEPVNPSLFQNDIILEKCPLIRNNNSFKLDQLSDEFIKSRKGTNMITKIQNRMIEFVNSCNSINNSIFAILKILYDGFRINEDERANITEKISGKAVEILSEICNNETFALYEDNYDIAFSLITIVFDIYQIDIQIPENAAWYRYFKPTAKISFINKMITTFKQNHQNTDHFSDDDNEITVLLSSFSREEDFLLLSVEKISTIYQKIVIVDKYKFESPFTCSNTMFDHDSDSDDTIFDDIQDHLIKKSEKSGLTFEEPVDGLSDYLEYSSETENDNDIKFKDNDLIEERNESATDKRNESDTEERNEEESISTEESSYDQIDSNPKKKKSRYADFIETEKSKKKHAKTYKKNYNVPMVDLDSQDRTDKYLLKTANLRYKRQQQFINEEINGEIEKAVISNGGKEILIDKVELDSFEEENQQTVDEINDINIDSEEEEISDDDQMQEIPANFFDLTVSYNSYDEAVVAGLSHFKSLGPRMIKQKHEDGCDVGEFKCQNKKCKAYFIIKKVRNIYKIVKLEEHTCIQNVEWIKKEELDEVISSFKEELTKGVPFLNSVREKIAEKRGGPAITKNELPDDRIYRRKRRVFGLDKDQRFNSWSKLVDMAIQISKAGGRKQIIVKKDQTVHFVGVMPKHCIDFIKSDAFFPVLISDGTFLKGLGRGVLLIIVALTGNRNVLPIAWSWAESEDKLGCEGLYTIIAEFEEFIETMIEDGGTALNNAMKSILPDINLQLCSWHLSKNIPANQRKMFWSLVKAVSLTEYLAKKNTIQNKPKYRILNEKLENKWQLISRFETNTPRMGCRASGAVESFNNRIANIRYKEPFHIFQFIYCYSIETIDKTLSFTNYLMPNAEQFIIRNLNIATRYSTKMYKKQGNIVIFQVPYRSIIVGYQVDLRAMTCTCGIKEDTGLPCPHLLKCCIQYGDQQWSKLIHPCYFTQVFKNVFNTPVEYLNFVDLRSNLKYIPPKLFPLTGKTRRIKSHSEISISKKKSNEKAKQIRRQKRLTH